MQFPSSFSARRKTSAAWTRCNGTLQWGIAAGTSARALNGQGLKDSLNGAARISGCADGVADGDAPRPGGADLLDVVLVDAADRERGERRLNAGGFDEIESGKCTEVFRLR